MPQPELVILVSSFERPRHVRRVLASIAAQRGVRGAFEVVVTDDGSGDETPRMVRQFAASASFPVRFTTHSHAGFHIARCRNEGAAASTAPYLLFLDGDCLIPPDHVRVHLDRRQSGWAHAGYPIYLDRAASDHITPDDVGSGRFEQHASAWQRWQMRWRHVRGAFHTFVRDPQRPKLLGGNLGIARADYERVNGYDENFLGWGCEDDDLRMRLRSAGVNVASIAWWTHTYHLWHPKTPSAPATWRAGDNVEYFRRPLRLTHCLSGLTKRRLQDLRIDTAGHQPIPRALADHLPAWCRIALAASRTANRPAEIELAVAPHASEFSTTADCRVLLIPHGQQASRILLHRADIVFSAGETSDLAAGRCFAIDEFDRIMQRHLGSQQPARVRAAAHSHAAIAAAA